MGSQMNGHFSAAGAGVAGYGAGIAKESLEKYKKAREEQMQKSRTQSQNKKGEKK